MDFRDQILDIGKRYKDDPAGGREELEQLCRDAGIPPRQAVTKIKKDAEIVQNQLQSEINELSAQAETLQQYADMQDGKVWPSVAIQKFKDTFPDIWQKVAVRIYKNADNYGDYRLAYLEWGWAHALRDWQEGKEAAPTYPHQMVLDVFDLHKEHGFPFFFVSKGICDAAWQSDLKFDVDWKTLRLPFEAFTFILPKDNPLELDGITVYRHTKDADMHFTLFGLGNGGLGTEITAPYPFDANADYAGVEVLRWVFNTIYAMSARPEYVEGGERVGTHKATRSEIWTPNVIGRKYAVKSHTFSKESSGSVRLHWRRGHFRQQAYGVGRLQHRVIWIEPMMVGGN